MKQTTLLIFKDLFERYPDLEECRDDVLEAFMILARHRNFNIYTCGNGGSACDAEHIVAELMKNFRKQSELDPELVESLKQFENGEELAKGLEPGFRAFSLVSQRALITAYANDHDPNFVYAQQVAVYGRKNDVLIALTTSGNSKNCVCAAEVAKAKGMKVIALTGQSGGEIKKYADVTIRVNETMTFKIQERHLPIFHCLCAMLEEECK